MRTGVIYIRQFGDLSKVIISAISIFQVPCHEPPRRIKRRYAHCSPCAVVGCGFGGTIHGYRECPGRVSLKDC